MLDIVGKIFAWQHDPEGHGNGIYTFFDNDAAGTANTGTNTLVDLPYSRAITVKLNFRTHVATLIKSDNQPEGLSAPSQGNAQLLRDGDLFVGWGALPYFSEFSPSGKLIFNAEFPAGVNTYRAYRLPWTLPPIRTHRASPQRARHPLSGRIPPARPTLPRDAAAAHRCRFTQTTCRTTPSTGIRTLSRSHYPAP